MLFVSDRPTQLGEQYATLRYLRALIFHRTRDASNDNFHDRNEMSEIHRELESIIAVKFPTQSRCERALEIAWKHYDKWSLAIVRYNDTFDVQYLDKNHPIFTGETPF